MGSDVAGCGKFQKTSSSLSKRAEEHNSCENRVKELVEANEKWQKYNDQREVCVKQLQEDVKSKDAKISELQAQVDATNRKYQASEESRIQLEKENEQLVGQLENATRTSDSSELLHLREQVKAYQEDFESERRDRERAQSRLADVEMELEIVKRELRQYNLREMQDIHQRRQASLEYNRQEYLKKNPQSVYQNDHFEDRHPEDGEDEIDG